MKQIPSMKRIARDLAKSIRGADRDQVDWAFPRNVSTALALFGWWPFQIHWSCMSTIFNFGGIRTKREQEGHTILFGRTIYWHLSFTEMTFSFLLLYIFTFSNCHWKLSIFIGIGFYASYSITGESNGLCEHASTGFSFANMSIDRS